MVIDTEKNIRATNVYAVPLPNNNVMSLYLPSAISLSE